MHGAVAEQPGHRGPIEAGAVEHPTAPAGQQVFQLDHHVQVRAVTASGPDALVVEEEPAHIHKGIGPAGVGKGDSNISMRSHWYVRPRSKQPVLSVSDGDPCNWFSPTPSGP